MNTVNLGPLSEHVGVEAVGIDLNTVDDRGFGALRQAVDTIHSRMPSLNTYHSVPAEFDRHWPTDKPMDNARIAV